MAPLDLNQLGEVVALLELSSIERLTFDEIVHKVQEKFSKSDYFKGQ